MATSGTTGYLCTARDIINAAASKIGVKENGQALSAGDLQVFLTNLNMIVKQWTTADFAPGLKMWTTRRAYLFLQQDQIEYDIGPSGDECAADSYITTTLTSEVTASTSIVVDSSAGITSGMHAGVVQTDGSIYWTTVSGAPSGSTVNLAGALTGTASSGARCFFYASKPVRPFEIVSGALRDSETNDTPIDVNLSLAEYEQLPAKTSLGTPSALYFEAQRLNARVFLNRAPEDVNKVLRLTFYSYVEDNTAQTEDVDFPAEWYRALVGQLALDSALDFAKPVSQELIGFAADGLSKARNAYPQKSTAYYQPDPDSY